MKIFNKHIKFTCLLTILFFYSCDLEETNISPNNATTATVEIILPVAQTNLIWAISDYTAQATSILLQQMTGVLNEQQNITNYGYLPSFF